MHGLSAAVSGAWISRAILVALLGQSRIVTARRPSLSWQLALVKYFQRLVAVFGGRYVAIVIAVYGINQVTPRCAHLPFRAAGTCALLLDPPLSPFLQGVGEGWGFFAAQYFFVDPISCDDVRTTCHALASAF